MTEPPYPGYDVLAKRDTPSWNAKTRRVIDQRLASRVTPRFFTAEEFRSRTPCRRRIVPQPAKRTPVPLAALLDAKLLADRRTASARPTCPISARLGDVALPRSTPKRGACIGSRFPRLDRPQQDALLQAVKQVTRA